MRSKEKKEWRFVLFAHEFVVLVRRRVSRTLCQGSPQLTQRLLQLLSIVFGTVLELHVAFLRGVLMGILLLLPFVVVVLLYYWVSPWR